MSGIDPRAEYGRRLAEWDAVIAHGARAHLHLSNFRLLLFALAALLAWLALARGLVPLVSLVPVAAAFIVLLVVHARRLNANDRARRARRYYERGLARLDGTWKGSGADGARFDHEQSYAADLDLFGPGSLFQLLNTTVTEIGEETLAGWLREASDVGVVLERQAAVAELRDRTDFREALAVQGSEARVSRTSALGAWAAAAPVGLGNGTASLFAVCAVINAVLVASAVAGAMNAGVVMLWLIVPGLIARAFRGKVWKVLRRVDAAEHDLSRLSALLVQIEAVQFDSPRLVGILGRIGGHDLPSRQVGRLRRYIAARDSLRNEFVRPFALLLFVRSLTAIAIDRWHAGHRAHLAAWLAAVGELEALASLATYAFEHPADPFPRLTDDGARFEGVALAHPLIPAATAVRNDVRLGGASPHVLIVSGSNMSGKSTLLRTVGVNVVLALAGAPVRAESLALSPLTIGATMGVHDSLQAGQSRFYAEIVRIRGIVEQTRHPRPVLFLLDEILHGTNSHDRRIGAEAIVKALVERGAIGLVTTHDLALASLVEALGSRARNVHFEDHVTDGRMVFDYRMREGVVTRSNALELMRAVGLDVF